MLPDVVYFGHVEEDFLNPNENRSQSHFVLDDIKHEIKILDRISEMIDKIDEFQDEELDLVVCKVLKLQNIRNNLKINIQEAPSSFHVAKSNKKNRYFS